MALGGVAVHIKSCGAGMLFRIGNTKGQRQEKDMRTHRPFPGFSPGPDRLFGHVVQFQYASSGVVFLQLLEHKMESASRRNIEFPRICVFEKQLAGFTEFKMSVIFERPQPSLEEAMCRGVLFGPEQRITPQQINAARKLHDIVYSADSDSEAVGIRRMSVYCYGIEQ